MKNTKKKEQDKAIKVVIGIIIVMVLLFIFGNFYISSKNNFISGGVKYNKNYFGDIPFYTAAFTMTDSAGKEYNQEIDFRNDPRTLKDIPVILGQWNSISFLDAKVFVTTKPNISTCNGDTTIGLINNARLFSTFGYQAKGAFDDPYYKNNTDYPYVNCENRVGNTIIMLLESNETKIERVSRDCYKISFKDCEVLRALEKFEISVIEQYVKNTKK